MAYDMNRRDWFAGFVLLLQCPVVYHLEVRPPIARTCMLSSLLCVREGSLCMVHQDLHADRRADANCLYGANGYWEIFNFSVVTQQTIGCGRPMNQLGSPVLSAA